MTTLIHPASSSNSTAPLFFDRSAAKSVTLAEAIGAYEPIVFSLAMRLTNSRPAAEDITQDVFLRLWLNPDSFDPTRGSIRTWLLCVCHGRSIDWIRRETAHRRRDTRRFDQPASYVSDTEDVVLAHDARDIVRSALAALPTNQRRAITLAYFGGLTYREVAGAMNVPQGTAKSYIRLGLTRLGRLIDCTVIDQT
jgi:RNA polymerase sigma-70 factor (ECF subfamily)